MSKRSKVKAIEGIKKALEQIPNLMELATNSPEFEKWRRNTWLAIGYAFGKDSDHVSEFYSISFFPSSSAPPDDIYFSREKNLQNRYKYENESRLLYEGGLKSAASLLESMLGEIEEYWPEEEDPAQNSASSPRREVTDTQRVFVVHGRDHGTREAIARFIEKLGLEAVILEEQADRGSTIIAKFEKNAQNVSFVVVLLTPDDEGRIQGRDAELKHRARQNVIFELGYFAGTLGRNRVCSLTKGDVELPSDYDGVIYIPLDDSGGWKLKLVKELQAAGFDVDANHAL